MRSFVVAATLLLAFGAPSAAEDTTPPAEAVATEAAACSAGSYVAVAGWSAESPVRLSVLPLFRPLGEPRIVSLPAELEGPAALRCEAGALFVSTPGSSFAVRKPASRSRSVEPETGSLSPTGDGDFAHYRCRNGLSGDGLWLPLEAQMPLPKAPWAIRDERYSFGVRHGETEDGDETRWRLVVRESQLRGVPSGRLAPAHVDREVTILELVCEAEGTTAAPTPG